jgi:hypothetical protein
MSKSIVDSRAFPIHSGVGAEPNSRENPADSNRSSTCCVVFIATLALLAGCSSNPYGGATAVREAATDLRTGDAIAITVSSIKQCGTKAEGECTASPPSILDEVELEHCVSSGLSKRLKNITMVHGSKFRSALVADAESPDLLRSADATLAALAHPKVPDRLRELNVRYVVVVDMQTMDSPTQSGVGADAKQGAAVIGVGRSWTHTALYTATILDVREVRRSGVVSADASGKAGYAMGVALLYILPVPFVVPTSYSGSESLACTRLADEAAQFLIGGDSTPLASK